MSPLLWITDSPSSPSPSPSPSPTARTQSALVHGCKRQRADVEPVRALARQCAPWFVVDPRHCREHGATRCNLERARRFAIEERS